MPKDVSISPLTGNPGKDRVRNFLEPRAILVEGEESESAERGGVGIGFERGSI